MADLDIDVGGSLGRVSGILLRPPDAWLLYVLAHGAGAGMRHRFMEAIAAALAARRVATLRYQFPYMEAGGRRPDPPGGARGHGPRRRGRGGRRSRRISRSSPAASRWAGG